MTNAEERQQAPENWLGATVPRAWVDRFEAIASQTGRSRDELVRAALGQYLGIDRDWAVTDDPELKALRTELEALRSETLRDRRQLHALTIRLNTFERLFSADKVAPASKEAIAPLFPDDDEEIDDEPDEILFDFLPPRTD